MRRARAGPDRPVIGRSVVGWIRAVGRCHAAQPSPRPNMWCRHALLKHARSKKRVELNGWNCAVQVLVEPVRDRCPQSEMELDFVTIQGSPFPKRGRKRFAIGVDRAKFDASSLNAIFVTRSAISGSNSEIAQARKHDPLLLQLSS